MHNDFMSAVKAIESQIMEEVSGSQEYMACSERWKNSCPSISANYAEMAKQELEHAKKLQEMFPLIKGTDEFTDEQMTIIKFLVEMNNDQIRRIATK